MEQYPYTPPPFNGQHSDWPEANHSAGPGPHRSRRRNRAVVAVACVATVTLASVAGAWGLGVIGDGNRPDHTSERADSDRDDDSDGQDPTVSDLLGWGGEAPEPTIPEPEDFDPEDFDIDIEDYDLPDPEDFDIDVDLDDEFIGGSDGSGGAPELSGSPEVLPVADYAARSCIEVGPLLIAMTESSAAALGDPDSVTPAQGLQMIVDVENYIAAEIAFNDLHVVQGPEGATFRDSRALLFAEFSDALTTFDVDRLTELSSELAQPSPLNFELAAAALLAPECSAVNSAQANAVGGLISGIRS